MKISSRNVLKGKVKSLNHGTVNSEVVVELPGGQQIVSVVTKTSAEQLGLAMGKEVYAVNGDIVEGCNFKIGLRAFEPCRITTSSVLLESCGA